MPTYEYMCKKCGPFTQLRPMAECDLPSACPECGARSPRVMLTAPGCLTMSSAERQQGVKYERILERYDGHEPPSYLRPPSRPRRRHVPQGEESASASLMGAGVSANERQTRSEPLAALRTRFMRRWTAGGDPRSIRNNHAGGADWEIIGNVRKSSARGAHWPRRRRLATAKRTQCASM
jgi:putative FmdB family regulatory protein